MFALGVAPIFASIGRPSPLGWASVGVPDTSFVERNRSTVTRRYAHRLFNHQHARIVRHTRARALVGLESTISMQRKNVNLRMQAGTGKAFGRLLKDNPAPQSLTGNMFSYVSSSSKFGAGAKNIT